MAMRTIVEEDEAVGFFAALAATYPRVEDIWQNGWKWRLSRDPERDATAVTVPGISSVLYLLKTPAELAEHGIPAITIMYTFDDKNVNVLGAEIIAVGA